MGPPILLHTKFLIPRTGPDYLPRPRLLNQIKENIHRRLILVTAPPGYGKTALLAEFAVQADVPVAWYQLDLADNDPITFLACLIASLRQLDSGGGEGVGTAALALLNSVDAVPGYAPERIIAVLLNDLMERATCDWVIVLEDYHLISNTVVHQLVDYLIDNAPPQLHLILSTRSTPPLSIARLRARGMLAEIRVDELRFRPNEIEALVADWGSAISSESVRVLGERTEGWAAGLLLALSSVSDKDSENADRFITDLKSTHRYIFEYLADEVFRRQPPEIQEFLLSTAVLDQMDAAACNALMGGTDAQAMLEKIEQLNLFVVRLDVHQEWYRYHYLFREFLLEKLRREAPRRAVELDRVAGAYYEAQGEMEAALTHHLRAENAEQAARILARYAPEYVEHGRVEVLHRYFSILSNDLFEAYPELLLYHGDALRQLGQVGTAIGCYEDALSVYSRVSDPAGASRALTRLAELERAQGNYRRAQALAADALERAPAEDHVVRAQALMELARSQGFTIGMNRGRALGEEALQEADKAGEALPARARAALLRSLGRICWWYGDPQAAVRYCRDALHTFPDRLSPVTAQIYMALSTPYLYWSDLETARVYAERGLQIVQELQLTELFPRAYMVLGHVLARTGELTRAENSLKQALEWADRLGGDSYERVMAVGTLAYVLCLQERFGEAQQLAQSVLWSHVGSTDTYEMVVCRSVLADVALELDQLDQARHVFEDLLEVAQRRHFQLPLAMIYFGLAYIYLKDGQTERGLEMARQSLDLLGPTNAIQLYLDQGRRARVVCRALQEAGVEHDFITHVLDRLPATGHVTSQVDESAVQIYLLGPFRVVINGEEVTQDRWVSTKARDLLAYFATFRHERIPLDRALDAVWPDVESPGKTAFHTALHRLRSALRGARSSTKFVLVEAGEYMLDTARFRLDVDDFDMHIAKAQNADNQPGAISLHYQAAVDLYAGEYLDNLYFDWLLPERRRLQESYVNALRMLTSHYQHKKDYRRALLLARRALQVNPLLEEFHCTVMECLAALRDRTGVIRHYQTLKELLSEELHTQPMDSTERLYQSLIKS